MMETGSSVIFGGVDKNEYVGDIFRLDTGSDYYWAPEVAALAYGDRYIQKFDLS